MKANLDGKCCDNHIVEIVMMRTLEGLPLSVRVVRLGMSGPALATQSRQIHEEDVGPNGELQQRNALRSRFPLKI